MVNSWAGVSECSLDMHPAMNIANRHHKPRISIIFSGLPQYFAFFGFMIKMEDIHHSYSALSASIGSRFDARHAGYTPETIQITIPTSIADGM